MKEEVGIKVVDGFDEVKSAKSAGTGRRWKRYDVTVVAMRAACLVTSVLSTAVMVTSEEHGTLTIYGFHMPVHSKWSFSQSMEFLVAATATAAAHSLLQLVLSIRSRIKKSSLIPSRNHAWFIFAADQALAYAMMSAGSAAAGVTNLNKTGIRHSPLPDFCKPLNRFCDRMAISITLGFLTCVLLAVSAVLDVLWLSRT